MARIYTPFWYVFLSFMFPWASDKHGEFLVLQMSNTIVVFKFVLVWAHFSEAKYTMDGIPLSLIVHNTMPHVAVKTLILLMYSHLIVLNRK